MRYFGILFIALMFSSAAFSAVIFVPDDYPLIQDAINAAAIGDTIIVREGMYDENLNFSGKAIAVISEDGPQVTVIDGTQTGSCVVFISGEGKGSVIEGFTLTNGSGHNGSGGGVACDGSSPTIRNNHIVDNAAGNGGGISCRTNSSPDIVGNVIAYNDGPGAGGAMFLHTNCAPLIANNIMVGNTASSATGGGIYIGYSSDATVTNNTIYGNSAAGFGSIFSYSSSPVITNTISRNNSPNEIGGSVTVNYSNVEGGMTGTGNIDADPLFVDAAFDDFHLTYGSPCKDTGDNSVVSELVDFEGDPRIAFNTVDMGADEFFTHLYVMGDQTPGGDILGKLVGEPGASPVYLIISANAWETPLSTPYGDLYLMPPRIWLPLIPMPSNGVLTLTAVVPSSPPAPYDVPIQALIGLASDSLTNLYVLRIR